MAGAEGGEAGLLELVTVEEVVGVEGDDAPAIGVGDVDAGLLDGAGVKGVGINELDDEDAEEVLVAESLREADLWKAAQ